MYFNVAVNKAEAWFFRNLSKYWKMYQYNMREKNRENYLDKLQVLYKSENYVAVDKDFDIIINTQDEGDRLSVFDQIAHRYPELVNPSLVHGFYVIHRLDYSTSGVLLVGLTKKAASEAAKLFEARKTRKYYLGIVHGHLKEDKLDINMPIGTDKRPEWEGVKMCSGSKPYCSKPRKARTRVVVLERGHQNGNPATKVMMAPVTGRRHQLRVHLSESGHTLVGDYTYSDRRDITPYRMFLHAYRLCLPSGLEDLDIQTKDPFTPDDPINGWQPSETLLQQKEAFTVLDNVDNKDGWTEITEAVS